VGIRASNAIVQISADKEEVKVEEDCVILDIPEGLRLNLLGLVVQIDRILITADRAGLLGGLLASLTCGGAGAADQLDALAQMVRAREIAPEQPAQDEEQAGDEAPAEDEEQADEEPAEDEEQADEETAEDEEQTDEEPAQEEQAGDEEPAEEEQAGDEEPAEEEEQAVEEEPARPRSRRGRGGGGRA
jgi:cobalamin biosynthesis protein CobT